MKKSKYDVSDELKDSILTDIENGVKWKQIALANEVDYKLVQSVCQTERKRMKSMEAEEGGVIRYWNGMRLTDGKPSPVKKYHISELER